jgi:hypothetical protein
MGSKQLKIALSDELYNLLTIEAKKQNLPVSSFARSLMSAQLEQGSSVEAAEIVQPDSMATKSEETSTSEDLIFLSDVLEDKEKQQKESEATTTSTKKVSKGEKSVNIQITVN